MNLRTPATSFGFGIFRTTFTFSASALSPLEVIVWPMNFTFYWLNFILSLFNLRRFSLHISMNRMKFLSWFSCVSATVFLSPITSLSSCMILTPVSPSGDWCRRRWNSSGAVLHWFKMTCGDSGTCQTDCWMSSWGSSHNQDEHAIFGVKDIDTFSLNRPSSMSSIVGIG